MPTTERRFGRCHVAAIRRVACRISAAALTLTLGCAGRRIDDEPRPRNIVVVMTDDLDLTAYSRMERLQTLLGQAGTTFMQDVVSLSPRCPSPGTTLSGNYGHNRRDFAESGSATPCSEGADTDTIAQRLQDAGYRTALFGDHGAGGWTQWYSPVAGRPEEGYHYTLDENGRLVSYGGSDGDYFTDVLANKAAELIEGAAADRVPFFAYVAPVAPHAPATPPRRYLDAFEGEHAPRTPAFDEADVSDKPPWCAALPRLSDAQIEAIDRLHRQRLASMLAVEDLVATLIETLDAVDQLDDTYILFTSDGGFHLGQHRLPPGTGTPFEHDVRVPLVIRGPGVRAGRHVDSLIADIDYAPTVLEWADLEVPDGMDGRSLGLLAPDRPPTDWRRAILLEHRVVGDASAPVDPPGFIGVRTSRYTYVQYDDGELELYDNIVDPDQLDNLVDNPPASVLEELRAYLAHLRNCAGEECSSAP